MAFMKIYDYAIFATCYYEPMYFQYVVDLNIFDKIAECILYIRYTSTLLPISKILPIPQLIFRLDQLLGGMILVCMEVLHQC